MLSYTMKLIRISVVMLLAFTLVLGAIYPLAVTAASQLMFSEEANGNLLKRGGVVVGSRLLGQNFSSPHYFWGRPSATSPAYNAAASAGSNMNPANSELLAAVNARVAALKKHDTKNAALIPVDLVTASGSGLDPHISLKAALYQVPRVARLRKMPEDELVALVQQFSEKPFFGLLDEEVIVQVLPLNLALDEREKTTDVK